MVHIFFRWLLEFPVSQREPCVTGRRRLERSAGNSGSFDVAVSLSSMAGAMMTIEEATRKPFWGRSETGKAGPAPRVCISESEW